MLGRLPDPESSRAILIGTSDYERSDKLANLPAVRGNLSGLERALTDPELGVFKPERCTVIDSPDSARSLMGRLVRAAETAEDVLLVYYAGHGTLDRNGRLHLTVRETDPDPYRIEGTAVPFSWISEVVEDSPAQVRVMILDCCFSGQAVGAMSTDAAALEQIKVSGTYVLTSSEADSVSRAIPGEQYTAFTGTLIELLRSGRSPDPLTLGQLDRKLRVALASRNLPRPTSRADNTSGDLVVRRGQPEPPAPPEPVVQPQPAPPAPAVQAQRAPEPVIPAQAAPVQLREAPEPRSSTQSPIPTPTAVIGALSWRNTRDVLSGLWIAVLVAVIICCLFGFVIYVVLLFEGYYTGVLIWGAIGLPVILAALIFGALLLIRREMMSRWHRQVRASGALIVAHARERHRGLGDRQVQVLELLAGEYPKWLSANEIARRMDYDEANAHLALQVLVGRALVTKIAAARPQLYKLSTKAIPRRQR